MRQGFHEIPLQYLFNEVSNETSFTVPMRYSNLEFINAGTQGIVVSAADSVTGTRVAIKKLINTFQCDESARRAFREIVLASAIVKVLSVFSPDESEETFQEIYLVMELMEYNLKMACDFELTHETLSRFFYQILCATNHLHREEIFHRDLKPANIACNGFNLKVLDFGLARLAEVAPNTTMTAYVITRYFRSPEVVLGVEYSDKADMWSVGCIFAQLINGEVLFLGQDTKDQWLKIIDKLGTPSEEFLAQLQPTIANYTRTFPVSAPMQIEEFIPDSNFQADTEVEEKGWTAVNARDLISKLLEMDPRNRLSAAEALQHPYVTHWHTDEEMNAPLSNGAHAAILAGADQLTVDELKSRIYQEVKNLEISLNIFG